MSNKNVQKVINSWSVATRFMWDIPWDSHRYFVEELGGTHAKNMLFSRYVTFVQSLARSDKFFVQFLFQLCKKNVMTVTGQNIRHILTETGSEDILKLKASDIKRKFKICEFENEDKWKVDVINEWTNVKQGFAFIEDNDDENFLSRTEIEEFIDYVSTC